MADWYVSSATYAAIPTWAASTAYTVGQTVRPLTTTFQNSMVYRCTTAGTSGSTEPTWSTAQNNGSTRTDNTVTWTNVSGQAAYGWGAAAGNLWALMGSASSGTNRPAVGDRVFVSSDHSENNSTINGAYQTGGGGNSFGATQIISVNRAGSVPPVAADILPGATITHSNAGQSGMILDAGCNAYWQGISFISANGSGSSNIYLGNNSALTKEHYFKDCKLWLNSTNSNSRIGAGMQTAVILDNTPVQFGHIGQALGSTNSSNAAATWHLTWLNTPTAILGATVPTTLFTCGGNTVQAVIATCRGVDLSAVTGNIYQPGGSAGGTSKFLLDSCKIAASVARLGTTFTNSGDEIELVNCFDGTNAINERHTPAGSITTDRSTYLTSGAQDDLGAYSLKLVSSSRSDKYVMPLDCFAFDVGNTAVGASKTATIELISSGSLNNDDISLLLEYMGTSGSPIASFASTLPSILTAGSALPSSSNTWTSPPATPQKQLLQATFTPQRAGRVRGLVRLGKPSATVWINPQIAIV